MKGFLLDTNVVSEPVRARPSDVVLDWLRSIPRERAYISVLTLAELDKGIEMLTTSDPRQERLLLYRSRLEADFGGRILSLEDDVVRLWGTLAGRYRKALGGEAPAIDALLAATALHKRLYFATRNVRHVQALGCATFDPWSDDPADFPLGA